MLTTLICGNHVDRLPLDIDISDGDAFKPIISINPLRNLFDCSKC